MASREQAMAVLETAGRIYVFVRNKLSYSHVNATTLKEKNHEILYTLLFFSPGPFFFFL